MCCESRQAEFCDANVPYEHQLEFWLFFLLSPLPVNIPKSAQEAGPCSSHLRLQWTSQVLNTAWPSPACCGYRVVNNGMENIHPSLSKAAFQVNVHYILINTHIIYNVNTYTCICMNMRETERDKKSILKIIFTQTLWVWVWSYIAYCS